MHGHPNNTPPVPTARSIAVRRGEEGGGVVQSYMAPWDPRVSGSALIPVTPPTWRVAVSGGGTISPSIPLLTALSSPLAPELILWDR